VVLGTKPISCSPQGRYLPVFASAVYDSKALAIAQGHTPVNLKSVMIGNGATSFFACAIIGLFYLSPFDFLPRLVPSYYTMACTNASGVAPALPISMCADMRKAISTPEIEGPNLRQG